MVRFLAVTFFVGFSQDVQFELFGGQKLQIERLEKTCGGSIPGGHFFWLDFLKTSNLSFLGAKNCK